MPNESLSEIESSGNHVLQRRPALNVWQSLMVRALLVFALIGIALVGHWMDRDGLKDNIDNHISFSDVVYFTTITITTVGYGDIVPVSDKARMFDAFVVTPIRVFVWLIFLGTAYNFVFRRTFERMRTAMIRKDLVGHTLLCGFGAKGEYAARELLSGNLRPERIVVVDPDAGRVATAVALGMLGIQGDATQNDVLKAAQISKANAVLVSTSRDDAAALVTERKTA
jgi:voltage-gated potassium channel